MTTTAERPLSERELCELEMAVTGDRDCADLADLITRLIHQVRNPGPLDKAISERDKEISERRLRAEGERSTRLNKTREASKSCARRRKPSLDPEGGSTLAAASKTSTRRK